MRAETGGVAGELDELRAAPRITIPPLASRLPFVYTDRRARRLGCEVGVFMDAMALLCTLHADGPATLKRLRQAGCATLDAVVALDSERLGALVPCTPAAARRLQKEARTLRERLQGSASPAPHAEPSPRAPLVVAQDECEHDPVATSESIEDAAAELAPALDTRAVHSAASPGESVAIELHSREKRLLARVVETWRSRDAEDDANEAPSSTSLERFERVNPAERGEELAVVPPSELGTPLHPHDLDGLDAELVARLSAAGVASLELLARADAVELMRRVPVGYSRLARLVALARRALPPARETSSPAEPLSASRVVESDKFSRSELPFALKRPEATLDLPDGLKRTPVPAPKERPTTFEADREGAGGPFV